MKRTIVTGASLVLLALAAGCGSSGKHNSVGSRPSPSSTAPAPLTCGTSSSGQTFRDMVAAVASDQISQDKGLQENWVEIVSGNPTRQGQDLQSLINATNNVPSPTPDPLATDAKSFNFHASTFLSDESSGLMPGWPSEYRAVERDIRSLAQDCRITPLPSPLPSS